MLGLEPGGAVVAMRMLQLAHGPDIELFEMRAPHQQPAQRPSDFSLQHFAIYVDDIDAATARFEAAGGTLLTGANEMLGVEKGAGNRFCYGRTPWGTVIEFLTAPGSEEYEQQTPLRRWKPAT